jgi:hypothetical protein
MKLVLKYLKTLFLITIIFMGLVYGTFSFFAHKVQEDYDKLVQSNRYTLVPYSSDLYIMCMLDYHINPNGKHMLQECNKIAKIADEKPKTPYYDFYIKYLTFAPKTKQFVSHIT